MGSFQSDDLRLLDATREVRIETSPPDGPVHATVIWVVVVEGRVLVRSYRGPGARWYREALANPDTALLVDGRRLPTEAMTATDAESIEAFDRALAAKYAGDHSLEAMLADELRETTLELRPR